MQLTDLFRIKDYVIINNSLPHQEIDVDVRELLKLIRKHNAILARWTSHSTIGKCNGGYIESSQNEGWWHCVRENYISLDSLTSKQRYRIRKGLKNNRIWIASQEDINKYKSEIFSSYVASIEDYPMEYKDVAKESELFSWLLPASNSRNSTVWICQDIESDEIIGFAHCRHNGTMAYMSSVKLNPKFFKNEINAAIVFKICQYYLNELRLKYVCDGERNIRHKTEYQDYLVRVLDFRKAPCQLNILYNPILKPIVILLFPFRNIIGKLSKGKRFIYNIYCILMQEQYSRESKAMFCENK